MITDNEYIVLKIYQEYKNIPKSFESYSKILNERIQYLAFTKISISLYKKPVKLLKGVGSYKNLIINENGLKAIKEYEKEDRSRSWERIKVKTSVLINFGTILILILSVILNILYLCNLL